MAIAKRLEMERETILEGIRVDGVVIIARKKFILVGNGKNMSRSVIDAWVESWRDYVGDEDADLKVMETDLGSMVLWDSKAIVGGIKDLSSL